MFVGTSNDSNGRKDLVDDHEFISPKYETE